LLLIGATLVNTFRGFIFESFWPSLPDFMEVVQQAWEDQVSFFNPYLRLHIKLTRTAKELRKRAKKSLGNSKLLLCAAKQLVEILDIVQEFRQLSESEVLLRHDLKGKILGLTAVEKLRLKQQSRLSAIRAAEANSKLFYLYANGRRKKNFIKYLNSNGTIKHTQQEKEECVYQHFQQ